MEELIHIPYGACIVSSSGDVSKKIIFAEKPESDSLTHFYDIFDKLDNSEVAYIYFLTIDAHNLPSVYLGNICDMFLSRDKKKIHNSFYAQYGIYVYSISKSLPIHSCRINFLSKNSAYALSMLNSLYESAVAPSHITEVLESINEKTPA